MKVGFVGWRGMVGSVLMQRMREENDFNHIQDAVFFTTSNVGGAAPDFGQNDRVLQNYRLATLLLRVKAEITPKRFILKFVKAVGMVSGLTLHRHYA